MDANALRARTSTRRASVPGLAGERARMEQFAQGVMTKAEEPLRAQAPYRRAFVPVRTRETLVPKVPGSVAQQAVAPYGSVGRRGTTSDSFGKTWHEATGSPRAAAGGAPVAGQAQPRVAAKSGMPGTVGAARPSVAQPRAQVTTPWESRPSGKDDGFAHVGASQAAVTQVPAAARPAAGPRTLQSTTQRQAAVGPGLTSEAGRTLAFAQDKGTWQTRPIAGASIDEGPKVSPQAPMTASMGPRMAASTSGMEPVGTTVTSDVSAAASHADSPATGMGATVGTPLSGTTSQGKLGRGESRMPESQGQEALGGAHRFSAGLGSGAQAASGPTLAGSSERQAMSGGGLVSEAQRTNAFAEGMGTWAMRPIAGAAIDGGPKVQVPDHGAASIGGVAAGSAATGGAMATIPRAPGRIDLETGTAVAHGATPAHGMPRQPSNGTGLVSEGQRTAEFAKEVGTWDSRPIKGAEVARGPQVANSAPETRTVTKGSLGTGSAPGGDRGNTMSTARAGRTMTPGGAVRAQDARPSDATIDLRTGKATYRTESVRGGADRAKQAGAGLVSEADRRNAFAQKLETSETRTIEGIGAEPSSLHAEGTSPDVPGVTVAQKQTIKSRAASLGGTKAAEKASPTDSKSASPKGKAAEKGDLTAELGMPSSHEIEGAKTGSQVGASLRVEDSEREVLHGTATERRAAESRAGMRLSKESSGYSLTTSSERDSELTSRFATESDRKSAFASGVEKGRKVKGAKKGDPAGKGLRVTKGKKKAADEAAEGASAGKVLGRRAVVAGVSMAVNGVKGAGSLGLTGDDVTDAAAQAGDGAAHGFMTTAAREAASRALAKGRKGTAKGGAGSALAIAGVTAMARALGSEELDEFVDDAETVYSVGRDVKGAHRSLKKLTERIARARRTGEVVTDAGGAVAASTGAQAFAGTRTAPAATTGTTFGRVMLAVGLVIAFVMVLGTGLTTCSAGVQSETNTEDMGEVELEIIDFFKTNYNWNNAQLAAVLANAKTEGGLNPSIDSSHSGFGDIGYGIFQFTDKASIGLHIRTDYFNWCAANGKERASVTAQCEYFVKVYGRSSEWRKLQSATSWEQAIYYFAAMEAGSEWSLNHNRYFQNYFQTVKRPAAEEYYQQLTSGSLSGGSGNLTATTATQKALQAAAKRTPAAPAGYCAAWVSNVYANAGYSVSGNACDMYYKYCTSTNKSQIKAGMIIAVPKSAATGGGAVYGHVGVCMGSGPSAQVWSSTGGHVEKLSLSAWINKYGHYATVKWGYPAGVR